MRAMAPAHGVEALEAAYRLLSPLRGISPTAGDAMAPAVVFDPVTAGGGRTWRPVPLPTPPPARTPDRPTANEITATPAVDLAALVRARMLTPGEIVDAFDARIHELNQRMRAFITITTDLPSGDSPPTGKLAGVPIGLKDLIDTAGIHTTCGSRIFADRTPTEDAESWRRLRQAGALLLGKLNTHEFAAGVTGDNAHYGSVRNPYDPDRIAGGSSSGSAAAVATGMAAAALGTDTGGSIRIPAACCGTVGLKPTYGLVPTAGTYPLAWSLDHVGPLARTVGDAALLLDVLAKTDAESAARAGRAGGLEMIRIGVPRAWFAEIVPGIHACLVAVLRLLEARGATLTDIALPDLDLMTAANRTIAYAEASAHHEPLLRSTADYGANIRPRMEAGRFLLAGEYLTAQRVRAALCTTLAATWADVDIVVTPTLPCTAPAVGSVTVDVGGHAEPVGTALIRYTGPFNLTGTPAISLPCGRDAENLPIGVQLVAPPYEERLLCYVAAAVEAAIGGSLAG
jgi:aspartyl-tRNA(Asn)/glutamyl-tRNA(Gln) amidotransferase subunit A